MFRQAWGVVTLPWKRSSRNYFWISESVEPGQGPTTNQEKSCANIEDMVKYLFGKGC